MLKAVAYDVNVDVLYLLYLFFYKAQIKGDRALITRYVSFRPAQWLARSPRKQKYPGSNPTLKRIFHFFFNSCSIRVSHSLSKP